MRNVCEKFSSRPTGLFCRFCWNGSARTLFLATARQLFSQSLSSHILFSCLENFSATDIRFNFWHPKLQKVSTHAFCSWENIFKEEWKCGFLNNLSKSTETTSMLSTNTSLEWNLYSCWSNHLVTSFRLEMNIGAFSKHQSKMSDTDRYKEYFITTRVTQTKVNTIKRIFEQWSELQVAKCLMVHVLSSNYHVFRFELWNGKKAKQRWVLRVISDIAFNQVRVYHERVYADNVVSKFCFVRSFSSQYHS